MTDDRFPPSAVLIPGRWQPLHAGHVALLRRAMEQYETVHVGIFETPTSDRNPWSVTDRMVMFWGEFAYELLTGRMRLIVLPWVSGLVYGRDCGWASERIKLPDAVETGYSGTRERNAACQTNNPSA